MESKKYIRKIQSKEDKRNNEIFISPLGLEILEKTMPVIQEVIDIMEQGINQKDKALIINYAEVQGVFKKGSKLFKEGQSYKRGETIRRFLG